MKHLKVGWQLPSAICHPGLRASYRQRVSRLRSYCKAPEVPSRNSGKTANGTNLQVGDSVQLNCLKIATGGVVSAGRPLTEEQNGFRRSCQSKQNVSDRFPACDREYAQPKLATQYW